MLPEEQRKLRPLSPVYIFWLCAQLWPSEVGFITISSGWETLVSLSPGNTGLTARHGSFLLTMCFCVESGENLTLDWTDSCEILGQTQTTVVFKISCSLLSCVSASLLCVPCHKDPFFLSREQQMRPFNSRSFYCRSTDTHQQRWELLTQFTSLGHKNCGVPQRNCSLAFRERYNSAWVAGNSAVNAERMKGEAGTSGKGKGTNDHGGDRNAEPQHIRYKQM